MERMATPEARIRPPPWLRNKTGEGKEEAQKAQRLRGPSRTRAARCAATARCLDVGGGGLRGRVGAAGDRRRLAPRAIDLGVGPAPSAQSFIGPKQRNRLIYVSTERRVMVGKAARLASWKQNDESNERRRGCLRRK
eukprot:1886606-Pleurochrysis_carterae.AAC.3